MCTALGLVIIGVFLLILGWICYKIGDWICKDDSDDPPWYEKVGLGFVFLVMIITILFMVGMCCYGLYIIAPAIGCYILGH